MQRFFAYYVNPDDTGNWINYNDHLKEIELLKPKWIPGPPTTTGWCWLKIKRIDKIDIKVWNISNPDDNGIIRAEYYQSASQDLILAHCPIQEPEE